MKTKAQQSLIQSTGYYRLSPNEITHLVTEEILRRRKARLVQVRSQASVNAAKLREAVRQAAKVEQERLQCQALKEIERKRDEQRKELEAECDRAVRLVGQAQKEANKEPDPRLSRMEAAQRNASVAEARFEVALNEHRRIAAEQEAAALATQKARAMALNVERARAAVVAALPPPSPPPYQEPLAAAIRSVTTVNRNPTTLVHRGLVPSRYAVTEADKSGCDDARQQGALEDARLRADLRKMESGIHESRVTAELRGVSALQREHTRHDYEDMVRDLGALQRGDRVRKGRALADTSRLVAGAPVSVAWSDAAQAERLCERVFEQQCLHNKAPGAPQMFLEPRGGTADLSTSNIAPPFAVNNSPSRLDISRNLPQDLLDRIKIQRDAWAAKEAAGVVPLTPPTMDAVLRSPSPYDPEKLHTRFDDLSQARAIRAKAHKQVQYIDRQLRDEAQSWQNADALELAANAQRHADDVLDNAEIERQRHILEMELRNLEEKMAALHSRSAELSLVEDVKLLSNRFSAQQEPKKASVSMDHVRQYQKVLLERAAAAVPHSSSSSLSSAEMFSEVIEDDIASGSVAPQLHNQDAIPREVVAAKLRLQEHQMTLEVQKEALFKKFLQYRLTQSASPSPKSAHQVNLVLRSPVRTVSREFSCAREAAARVSAEVEVDVAKHRQLVEDHYMSSDWSDAETDKDIHGTALSQTNEGNIPPTRDFDMEALDDMDFCAEEDGFSTENSARSILKFENKDGISTSRTVEIVDEAEFPNSYALESVELESASSTDDTEPPVQDDGISTARTIEIVDEAEFPNSYAALESLQIESGSSTDTEPQEDATVTQAIQIADDVVFPSSCTAENDEAVNELELNNNLSGVGDEEDYVDGSFEPFPSGLQLLSKNLCTREQFLESFLNQHVVEASLSQTHDASEISQHSYSKTSSPNVSLNQTSFTSSSDTMESGMPLSPATASICLTLSTMFDFTLEDATNHPLTQLSISNVSVSSEQSNESINDKPDKSDPSFSLSQQPLSVTQTVLSSHSANVSQEDVAECEAALYQVRAVSENSCHSVATVELSMPTNETTQKMVDEEASDFDKLLQESRELNESSLRESEILKEELAQLESSRRECASTGVASNLSLLSDIESLSMIAQTPSDCELPGSGSPILVLNVSSTVLCHAVEFPSTDAQQGSALVFSSDSASIADSAARLSDAISLHSGSDSILSFQAHEHSCASLSSARGSVDAVQVLPPQKDLAKIPHSVVLSTTSSQELELQQAVVAWKAARLPTELALPKVPSRSNPQVITKTSDDRRNDEHQARERTRRLYGQLGEVREARLREERERERAAARDRQKLFNERLRKKTRSAAVPPKAKNDK